MTGVRLISLAGDRIVLGWSPVGFHLGVVPAEPPEEDALDIFTLDLSFSSVTRVLHCLRGGPPVQLQDFNFSIDSRVPVLQFAINHKPRSYFHVRLGPEESHKLEVYLSNILSGASSLLSPTPFPKRRQRISRNALCPCGSGKKYKKCCLGKEGLLGLPDRLTFAAESTDPLVQRLLEAAKEDPKLVDDSVFWGEVGNALGTSGDSCKALKAFQTASAMVPDNLGMKVNIAITEGVLGNYDKAVTMLANLPDCAPRKAIATANLFQEAGCHTDAIPYYEEAIHEEPDFYLPYARILNSLRETKSPLFDYWLQRAIQTFPHSPAIANFYCYHLLKNDRIPELAEATWIDSLRSEHGRPDIIGRNADDPRLIVEAQLFRAVGLINASQSSKELEKAITVLNAADGSWHLCDVAKLLAALAANLGISDAVRLAYDRICSHCKGNKIGIEGPVSSYLARAYRIAGDNNAAVLYAEESLRLDNEERGALWDYWWCLDELGRLVEAIEALKRLYLLGPQEEQLAYNLGYLYGKQGSLGLARHYYEREIERCPSNWKAVENCSFILVLDGELDRAKNYWQQYLVLFQKVSSEEASYIQEDDTSDNSLLSPSEFLAQKQAKWTLLLDFALRTKGSPSYALDLIELNESSEPIIGSHTTIGDAKFSIDKILDALEKPGVDFAAEVRHQLSMQQRGDQSKLIAALKCELPFLNELPSEARAALLEGERRLLEGKAIDHAPDVVSFAKAVEITLRTLVFDKFAQHCKTDIDIEKHIHVALQDKFKQAHNFIRFIERGQHVELGSMEHILRLCRGKTGQQLLLLGRLRDFIEINCTWPQLLSDESLEDLRALADRRNPAAHAVSYNEKEARETREIAVRELLRFQTFQ